MTDITCTYAGDREQTLIAYLYDDIEPAERASFDAHLPTCERCQRDVAALQGVRQELTRWAPPEPRFAAHSRQSTASLAPPASRPRRREIPVWAQVAAAMLVFGASLGIANLDVKYDANGLSVRTGWSKQAVAAAPAVVDSATRTELTALEQRLRNEFRTVQAASVSAPQPARATSPSDAEVLRRVRALVDESEKRQQRELALRVAQVIRDVGAQRQADLSKIDRNIGYVQNQTGVEILKQREMVNYLMRVSQRQ